MKFILAILICSQVGVPCLEPYRVAEKFDDGYDCMVQGYVAALEKIEDIGRKEVNESKIFIKFGCYPKQEQQGQPTKFDTLVKLW